MNGQTYELLVCCGHGGDACLVAAADESRASDHVSVCGEWHEVRQYDTTKWHSSCPRSSHPRLTCSHTGHHHHHADHSSRPQLTTTHPTRQPHTGEADEMQVRFGSKKPRPANDSRTDIPNDPVERKPSEPSRWNQCSLAHHAGQRGGQGQQCRHC
jgi:hypothetical protein